MNEALNFLTWQFIGDSEWIFGKMVRGIVRDTVAEVYHDEEQGGWVWFTTQIKGKSTRGVAGSLHLAINDAERALEKLI